MITHEDLTRCLSYDPVTGIFVWRVDPPIGPKRKDTRAGTLTALGYRQILINRRAYKEHRLAFFYVHARWPSNSIDHINGLRHDNRIDNLREATQAENTRNQRTRRDSASGLKCVHFKPSMNKWAAYIKHSGKQIHLGHFDTPDQAALAYRAAAQKLFGEFARFE